MDEKKLRKIMEVGDKISKHILSKLQEDIDELNKSFEEMRKEMKENQKEGE